MPNAPISENSAANKEVLPRSLYVTEKDPRASLREMVNAVFSDRFMISLSLIIIPLIILPLVFTLNDTVLVFFEICDWIIIILFVAEYITKLYVAQNRWEHFKSAWHIVDLVIIVLPFIQYLPLIEVTITGSPSLLLRLLRLPRAFAVGSRAIASRRSNSIASQKIENTLPETVIQQVDAECKTQNLSWDELKTHLADVNKHEWVHINYLSEEGFSALSQILGVPEPHFKSSLVDEIYPHIDYVQKVSFIFLQSGKIKYPEFAGNFLTIERSGIIVICDGTKIVTISRHGVDLIDKVLNSMCQRRIDGDFTVPALYAILDHTLNDYRSMLSEIELELIKIGNTHRSKLPRDFLERIYQLDKEVSRLVSNLVHFKDMLSIITSRKVPLEGFDEKAEEAFNVLQEAAGYLNEISHDLIENLRSIINLYINQTSFETNRILKILAVITAISVIPSAISGLMGTNMLDVPYGAFLWQLSFIIAAAMAFVAYTFVKLGWLKT